MSQSNTRKGVLSFVAGEDLTGMEDRCVKLSHDTGRPVVVLPTNHRDYVPYVLVEDASTGELVSVAPLTPEQNVRVVLKGECNPGEILVLADPSEAEDRGKVRALPVNISDHYSAIMAAEESGVDGQHLLARPGVFGEHAIP